jgi:ABC-type iron transport system FetAB ATPase subunit
MKSAVRLNKSVNVEYFISIFTRGVYEKNVMWITADEHQGTQIFFKPYWWYNRQACPLPVC